MSQKYPRAWIVPACALALAVVRFCVERYWDPFPLADSFQGYAHFNFTLANLQSAGELPQWLPYAVYGAPAAPYNQVFLSPLNLVTALLGSALHIHSAMALFNICLVLELWVCALGTWLLSGELFETRAARLAATFVAVFATNWHMQMFWTHRMVVYWPLLLYFVLRLRRDGNALNLAGACLAGMFLIYGSVTYAAPIYILFGLVTYAAAAACLGFRRQVLDPASFGSPPTRILFMLLVAIVGFYGWFLAHSFDNLVVLAPFRNVDGTVSLKTFLTYGGRTLEKLSEFVNGFPAMHLETTCYTGVMAAGLVLLAVLRGRNRAMCVMAAAFVFLFLLCLGPDGLLAYAAYYFPLANRFRHLSMLVPLARLLFLVLACFGVEALARAGEGAARLFRICLLAAPVMLLIKWMYLPTPVNYGWTALLPEIGAGLCLAAWLAMNLFRTVRPAHAAIAVLLLELALAQWAMDSHMSNYPKVRNNTIAGQDLSQVRPLEFRPHRLAESSGYPGWPVAVVLGARQPVNNVTLLHMAGVDLCVPIFRVDFLPESLVMDRPTFVEDVLLRSNMPMPTKTRLTASYWAETLKDPHFREDCGCGEFSKLTILDDPDAPAPEVLHFSANRLRVRTRTNAPAAGLRYADNYDPRWRASIDGKPAPVENAHPFKTLRLPPGEHVAEFVFYDSVQDWALRLSSIAAVLALVWLLAYELRADARESHRRADEAGPEA